MEKHRPVTEEDILHTEMLIAESYSRLKQSVTQAPSKAYQAVNQTVREHPYESVTVAAGAGVGLYGIFELFRSRKEAKEKSPEAGQMKPGRQDLINELMPIFIPLVTPYITGCFRKYSGDTPHEECGCRKSARR